MKLYFKNKFADKKKYLINQATFKDTYKILNFINKYWKKNHAFVKSKKLFNFQHKDKKKLNWIVAQNIKTKKIEGILGLISKNFYSKGRMTKKDDMWIAIIMVEYSLRPSKGLGTEMIKFFYKKFKPNSISAIGINVAVSNLYKKLGLKIRYLNQYYLKKKKKFSKLTNFENVVITDDIKKIKGFNNYDQKFKDYKYFLNRYFKHPIYKYDLYIIFENRTVKNFFVFRKVQYGKKLAIRVIDIGNIKLINKFKKNNFYHLINFFKANHLDFINFGIEKFVIKKIGLKLRKSEFIPHHFEPFERKNINIMFSYISNSKKFYVFKGDSDLDRPNFLEAV